MSEPVDVSEIAERLEACEAERKVNNVLRRVGREADFDMSAYTELHAHFRADIRTLLDALSAERAAHEETRRERDEAEAHRAVLISECREWMCDECSTVYPGPPQKGLRCVICPRCGGKTAQRTVIERIRLMKQLTAAEGERDNLRELMTALDEDAADAETARDQAVAEVGRLERVYEAAQTHRIAQEHLRTAVEAKDVAALRIAALDVDMAAAALDLMLGKIPQVRDVPPVALAAPKEPQ